MRPNGMNSPTSNSPADRFFDNCNFFFPYRLTLGSSTPHRPTLRHLTLRHLALSLRPMHELLRMTLLAQAVLGCVTWLLPMLSPAAQAAPRHSPSIRPVPLLRAPAGQHNSHLLPTEQELLEQFAPGSVGSSGWSSFGPMPAPGQPLQVPEARIPLGNVGRRGDISTVTAAQMPWNVASPALSQRPVQFPSQGNSRITPPIQNIGGGGPNLRPPIPAPAPALAPTPARSFRPSSIWATAQSLPALEETQTPRWRYRVFIVAPVDQAQTAWLRAQLQAWIPDVFVTEERGQKLLQLGSFGDRNRALLHMQQLQRLGLRPQMEGVAIQSERGY